jgi:hypothetical protein
MAVQVPKFLPLGRRDLMRAGGATTRLETSVGHPRVPSQAKAENGSVSRVDEESGASNYDERICCVFQQDVFTINSHDQGASITIQSADDDKVNEAAYSEHAIHVSRRTNFLSDGVDELVRSIYNDTFSFFFVNGHNLCPANEQVVTREQSDCVAHPTAFLTVPH